MEIVIVIAGFLFDMPAVLTLKFGPKIPAMLRCDSFDFHLDLRQSDVSVSSFGPNGGDRFNDPVPFVIIDLHPGQQPRSPVRDLPGDYFDERVLTSFDAF